MDHKRLSPDTHPSPLFQRSSTQSRFSNAPVSEFDQTLSMSLPAFRLREIPHVNSKSDVERTLKETFGDLPVTVQSLAGSPGQAGEKTATGNMPLPSQMSSETSLNIKCRCYKCSENILEGQKPVHDEDLVLDFKFEGLTILHSPIAENWEVE